LAREDHKRISILFTSVGRRVELLRAFRKAYGELRLKGKIVAIDVDPLAPALREADHPFIVPRLTSKEYLPKLIEICELERISMVFPLIDPDVPFLATNRDALEATGAKLAVVPPEAVAIASDKWLTAQFFQRLGLPAPISWLPADVDADKLHYPVFIKPRQGSAAKSAFKVNNAGELRFFTTYVIDPIIQEYLAGPEITNDVICDLKGEILAVVSRQRIEVRWGEVAKGRTVYNPVITDACLKIARGLPAVGPITIQCLMKNGVPHFTEINARLGGGAPLAVAAGADFPRWLLARAAEIPVEIPPVGTYKTDLYMSRFDDSFFLSATEYEKMASNSI
jgi:carbamoyl-phosphate synthase large subunit